MAVLTKTAQRGHKLIMAQIKFYTIPLFSYWTIDKSKNNFQYFLHYGSEHLLLRTKRRRYKHRKLRFAIKYPDQPPSFLPAPVRIK